MQTIHTTILRLLEKQTLKPGELSQMLGISRQSLHKHLKALIDEKKIQKHGSSPHVMYGLMQESTRVQKDYAYCREKLLPAYLDHYVGILETYCLEHCGQAGTDTATGKPDLGFLLDSAAVYSSNIEGNTLDLNSFLNSRMSPKKHRPKEAGEIEDLVAAYDYARAHTLGEKHMLHTHKMLSKEFVAPSRQGVYRREPVGVFSQQGLVYMAVEPHLVAQEMQALFLVFQELLQQKKTPAESFFWATWLHLMIALIHPFSDGNGRTARLCEKWFLTTVLGDDGFAVPTEHTYWHRRAAYYNALKLGANYWETDLSKASPFFALLPEELRAQP